MEGRKPGKIEAEKLIMDEIRSHETAACKRNMTFADAYETYVEMKSAVLSPSTLRCYKYIYKIIPDNFRNLYIKDIDLIHIQKLINNYSVDHAPKSVRNLNGLVSAVIKSQRPGVIFDVALPQKRKYKCYIPTDDDVKRILEAIKGTDIEVPIILATLGLRRSEIFALTIDDVDFKNKTISINKAKVASPDNGFVIKHSTKTSESTRTIIASDYLLERIKEQGAVTCVYFGTVSSQLYKVQKKLNIPHFSPHKLRHYFATSAHALGIPDQYIMALGGWKTDYVMQRVYRHAQEEATRINADKYLNHIHSLTSADA